MTVIKNTAIALAMAAAMSTAAYAGGLDTPVMEPEIIVEETTAGTGGGWLSRSFFWPSWQPWLPRTETISLRIPCGILHGTAPLRGRFCFRGRGCESARRRSLSSRSSRRPG
jgi:hypothetical protein